MAFAQASRAYVRSARSFDPEQHFVPVAALLDQVCPAAGLGLVFVLLQAELVCLRLFGLFGRFSDLQAEFVRPFDRLFSLAGLRVSYPLTLLRSSLVLNRPTDSARRSSVLALFSLALPSAGVAQARDCKRSACQLGHLRLRQVREE